MALRNHTDVKEARQVLAHNRDLARALDRDLTHALDHDLPSDRDRELARARLNVLSLVLELYRDLVSNLTLVRDPDRTRNLDHDLVRNLNRALDHARDLDDRRIRDLDHDLLRDLNRALGRALDHIRDLDLELELDRARDLNRALGLTRDLNRARDLARACAVIVEIRTAEVRRAIGLALRQQPPTLSQASLHTLLNDFTTADLSDANLTGIDLSGVHWSEHGTRWPPAIDVEDLKVCSDETPPDSGTWIVRSGTATIRDLADL
jgi:hypothetical protein